MKWRTTLAYLFGGVGVIVALVSANALGVSEFGRLGAFIVGGIGGAIGYGLTRALLPNAKAGASAPKSPAAVVCAQCGKNFGTDWHYQFEHVLLGQPLALQCRGCGVFYCEDHIEADDNGNFRPCAQCGAVKTFVFLSPGPAAYSMFDQARDYYGKHIRPPTVLGRPVSTRD